MCSHPFPATQTMESDSPAVFAEGLRAESGSNPQEQEIPESLTLCLERLDVFDFASIQTILFHHVSVTDPLAALAPLLQKASRDFPFFLYVCSSRSARQQKIMEDARTLLGNTFCICDEQAVHHFEASLHHPPIFLVLKKHPQVLKQWADILANTQCLKGNPLFLLEEATIAGGFSPSEVAPVLGNPTGQMFEQTCRKEPTQKSQGTGTCTDLQLQKIWYLAASGIHLVIPQSI